MATPSKVACQLLVLAAVVAHVTSFDDETIYNNELFPRNSKYGRLQEAVIDQEIESRQVFGPLNQNGQGLLGTNPFIAFINRLPLIRNPEFTPLLSTYDSCRAPNRESGLCLKAPACSLIGGRASGSCGLGTVCCISAIARCAGTITLNNTYWQSPPSGITPQSTCSVSVRLDRDLPEQKKQPICQVRLDFITFTIAQPAATTVCTDTFQATGTTNRVPTICGDNSEQHMYLNVPSTATTDSTVQLTFTFGAVITPRNWNIKITMIPCGASYAAPPDCLQYFTGGTGEVKSFNWIDAAVGTGATRQLANQDYSICFRNELINNQRATSICYQVCTVVNGGEPFLLTGDRAAGAVNSATTNCATDFLSILGGQSPVTPANIADRFCGGQLNSAAAATATSAQVCTTARPFRIHYRTDATDGAADTLNSGFCLSYMQRRQ